VVTIDNYDSFTFNLVQYMLQAGAVVDVYRNDAVEAAAVVADRPSHVLMSPGPGRPEHSGVCQELSRLLFEETIPTLGVCLGHQTLCAMLGAEVVQAERIMHGKLSPVLHDGSGPFVGLPSPFEATRYHSLIVDESTLPEVLVATAHTPEGELMGVRHRNAPVFGVQFHPESVLSEHGHRLIENFLDLEGQGEGAP
jgi:anthranilate synthase/aminodeoxychorismate synthase-like glutamine amidotransferase